MCDYESITVTYRAQALGC